MTDPTSPRERAEAFEALADARRSVRRFSDAPVPEEVMRSASVSYTHLRAHETS